MSKAELKIQNRFDNYQICAMFASSAQEYLNKHFLPIRRRFLYKCILGPLLAINAYLSHWGPWKWPNTYWLFVFSVIFYYGGSYLYEAITAFDGEGTFVGEYRIAGADTLVTVSMSKDKKTYSLELRKNKKEIIDQIAFPYHLYFTVSGIFLETAFHKQIATLLKTKKE